MSVDAALEFVDSNVLIYAHDDSAGSKRALARNLVERLWAENAGCLSVQVLQELYAAVTRRLDPGLAPAIAADRVQMYSAWRVFAPNAADVLSAIALHQQAKISFWDALIVHAAAQSGCGVLWTEDLNDGQVLRGVTIRNPFRSH